MKGLVSKDFMYRDGAARFHDLAYFIIRDRDLVKQDIEHSRFIAYDGGSWARFGKSGDDGDTNWTGVAVCVVKKPDERMVGIGEDGEILTYVQGTATNELIQPEPLVLRNLGVIDGFAYACGMDRQVYKRNANDAWIAMHAPPPPRDQTAGFEAIHGFSEKEVYAAGWNGEIWEWNGKTWTNHSSPTNLILTGVCCADDGNVYVCGQGGMLIRGRHDAWDVLELEDVAFDFWDVCWFKDRLYVATMTWLFTFIDGDFVPVDFGPDGPASCYRLSHADGILWSIGSNDVFNFDGTVWTRID